MSESGAVYTGSFKEGKRDGFGFQTYAAGGSYEGSWLADLKSGDGRERTPAYEYRGSWQHDMFHGQGTKYEGGGQITYEGAF